MPSRRLSSAQSENDSPIDQFRAPCRPELIQKQHNPQSKMKIQFASKFQFVSCVLANFKFDELQNVGNDNEIPSTQHSHTRATRARTQFGTNTTTPPCTPEMHQHRHSVTRFRSLVGSLNRFVCFWLVDALLVLSTENALERSMATPMKTKCMPNFAFCNAFALDAAKWNDRKCSRRNDENVNDKNEQTGKWHRMAAEPPKRYQPAELNSSEMQSKMQ